MGPFGGIEIVVSDLLPPKHVGHKITALNAVPWFARILRLFGISPFVCWLAEPMYQEPDAIRMGNKIIVTPKQAAELKKALA